MELKKHIIIDLENAKENGYWLLKYALQELLEKIGKISNESKIFDIIENQLENKAVKVMRFVKRNKINKLETEVYMINLFNSYLCKYKFKKPRQIIIQYKDDNYPILKWNHKTEEEPKVLKYKKRNFLNFFEKN